MIQQFADALQQQYGLYTYKNSITAHGENGVAMSRHVAGHCLAVIGPWVRRIDQATPHGAFHLAPLNRENAAILMETFPEFAPRREGQLGFSMGFGDRLGNCTPGQLSALPKTGLFPILAQQSTRELTLTGRDYTDVIADAAFGALRAGWRSGYGADGDHLKTPAEIADAVARGCTMITLDCSEHIRREVCDDPSAASPIWQALPEDVRRAYENDYLGDFDRDTLVREVALYHAAIEHAATCYAALCRDGECTVDFELSIDETTAPTTPESHLLIARELQRQGIRPHSMAPRFVGAFEKGIDYVGDTAAFEAQLIQHQAIADRFGYKLSVHSGSDKFAIFPSVARVCGGRVHVKTAGTSWLVALTTVAQCDAPFFRRLWAHAAANQAHARTLYHLSTQWAGEPDVAALPDMALPALLTRDNIRQGLHIAYGAILQDPALKAALFACLARHQDALDANLRAHFDRHIGLLAH